MPPVFGRPSASHPYDAALDDLQRSRARPEIAAAKNAIACNIRHDHRVSEDREERFDNFCRHPRTARELEQGLCRYFDKHIRTRDYPDFVYFEINGNNIIYGH